MGDTVISPASGRKSISKSGLCTTTIVEGPQKRPTGASRGAEMDQRAVYLLAFLTIVREHHVNLSV